MNDKAVNCLKAARRVEALVPFWELQPAMQRLVAGGENDAYIAEARGRAVVVFLPGGKKVTVDLKGFEGAREFHWSNIDKGRNGPMEKMNVKEPVKLQAPGPGNWVIVVK